MVGDFLAVEQDRRAPRLLAADAHATTRVLIHPFAGVLSAYGMGLADQAALKEKAAEALRERPELLEEIRTKVLERAGEVVLAAGEDEGE